MWMPSFFRKKKAEVRRGAHRRRGLSFEQLEDRVTPATFKVTNFGASAAQVGSLPWAVTKASQDQSATATLITFDAAMAGQNFTVTGTLDFFNTTKTVQINAPAGGVFINGGGVGSNFSIVQVEPGCNVVFNSVTLRNGSAGWGAAIANYGTVTLANCKVTNNSSTAAGAPLPTAFSGAIYNAGVLSAANCLFDHNSAINVTGSANFQFGLGGAVHNVGTMSISSCTFVNNSAGGNDGGGGGAIYSTGQMSVTGSSFGANGTNEGGGAIFNEGGNAAIANTTFVSNGAMIGGGALLNVSGSMTVVQSTFTLNGASPTSGAGGAIYNSSANLTLINATIARNSAQTGGGIYNNSGGMLLHNTLVALNTSTNTPDIEGNNADPASSYNLIGTTGVGILHGINGNMVGGGDPLLSGPGSFGGVGQTLALLPGSPAIDSGDNSKLTSATDQRGKPRTGTSDIGAFETQGYQLTVTSGNNQSGFLGTAYGQALVVSIIANNANDPVNGGKITFTAPSTGATVTLSGASPHIALARSSVNATANNIAGSFNVTATSRGATPAQFSLTNNPRPTLGALSATTWTVNQPSYSGTINITQGTGVYSNLTITGLPTGLSGAISGSTITITGTPTQVGVYQNVIVSVKDSSGTSGTATYSITISAGLTLGALSKTQWTDATAYTGTIGIVGGTSPYSVVSVTGLPAGLSYALAGNILSFIGTPSGTGTSTIDVTVQDTAGGSATASYLLTINAAPALGTFTGPTTWTVGQLYTATIGVTDGTTPFAKVTVTGLPNGLNATLSGSTITISGKPTQAGSFASVSVTAEDASGAKALGTYSLTINALPTFGPLSDPIWTTNQAYTGTIAINGGTAAFTNLVATGLPAGLSAAIVGSTVEITGTPTQVGTFKTIVLTAVDSLGATFKGTFSLTLKTNPVLGNLNKLVWDDSQPNYVGTIPITNGTAPYLVDSINGLPTGLSATVTGTNVVISGTPTGVGPTTIDLTIRDKSGATVTKSFTLTINPALTLGTLSVTDWTVQVPYVGTVGISGGTGAYKNLGVAGLPAGLTATLVGTNIRITGTPTAIGTFSNVKFSVQDAINNKVTATFALKINLLPKMTLLTQTKWTVNQPGFSTTSTLSGGTGAYTLLAATGLPLGLTASLSGSTATIDGVPTKTGSFKSVFLQFKDAAGRKFHGMFTINIAAVPTLGNLSVTVWKENKPNYVGTIAIAGGTGPFTIVNLTGLPAGLTATVSGSSVRITGTPTPSGAYPLSLEVADLTGVSVIKTFTLTITL